MKVLLVMPSIYGNDRPNIPKSLERKNSLEVVSRAIPLGLLYIGTYLKENGHKVKIIDSRLYDLSSFKRRVQREIKASDIVGFSVMTSQIPDAYDCSKMIKGIDKDIPIVWGGVHPSLFPEHVCTDENVDFDVKGEGEKAMLEIVKEVQTKGYKRKLGLGSITAAEPLDVNKIPFPDYSLLDMKRYLRKRHNATGDIMKSVEILTSRGCMHRCAFCINSIINKCMWRPMKPERANELIDYTIDKLKINHIAFADDSFMTDKNRAEKILKNLLNYDITWDATARANYFDNFDEDFMRLIKSSGCKMLSYGAESGSQRVLDYIKKDITVEQIINATKICNAWGIIPLISYMLAIPTETYDEMLQTIRLAYKLEKICPFILWSGPQLFRPYPGGELYEKCKLDGLVEPESLHDWMIFQKLITGYMDKFDWLEDKELVKKAKDLLFYMTILQKRKIYKKMEPKTFTQYVKKKGVNFISSIAGIRWKYNYWKLPIESRLILGMIEKGWVRK